QERELGARRGWTTLLAWMKSMARMMVWTSSCARQARPRCRRGEGPVQLLAMLLSSPDPDPASLMLLAKTVMPSGNSAFLEKPDIPTYLVGDSRALARFGELV